MRAIRASAPPIATGSSNRFRCSGPPSTTVFSRYGGRAAKETPIRRRLFADAAEQAALDAERARFMAELFQDMLGFAGLKMTRRILGYAHVADFETIADPARRAACERAALACARRLMVEAPAITSCTALLAVLPG